MRRAFSGALACTVRRCAGPARAGTVTLGAGGPSSGQHISGIYFQSATGTALRFVSYRAGSSDIMKDLVGGHIDVTFDQAISRPCPMSATDR
jgi:tripartite-type tricarboxylate transporter receptor subunit TctC